MKEKCKHCGLKPVYLRVTEGPREDPATGVSMPVKPPQTYVCDVDACIAPIVKALNDAGVPTSESCCGHGRDDGVIFLQDGRRLIVVLGER